MNLINIGDVVYTKCEGLFGDVMNVDNIENILIMFKEHKGCRFLNLNNKSKYYDNDVIIIKYEDYINNNYTI